MEQQVLIKQKSTPPPPLSVPKEMQRFPNCNGYQVGLNVSG